MILNDLSRFIVAWKLCTMMKAVDVTESVGMALASSGLIESSHRPQLLPNNGSSYVAGNLAAWLGKQNIEHVREAPGHPMTQGKIERWHQTMWKRLLLVNYFLPGDLGAKIRSFVDHFNHFQYHEGIGDASRRLCRSSAGNSGKGRNDQANDH